MFYQRINLPPAGKQPQDHNANSSKRLRLKATDKDAPIDPLVLHDTRMTCPDLAAVIDAWNRLPQAIKAGIIAMVKAAR